MTGVSTEGRRRSDMVEARYRAKGYGPGNTAEVRAWVITRMRAEGATQRACARLFGISTQLARHIENGRTAMYVTPEERELIREHRRRARDTRGGGADRLEDDDAGRGGSEAHDGSGHDAQGQPR